MEDDIFWLIPISAIVGGIIYAIVKEKAWARVRELEVRERIAMIEKGLIPPPESNPRGFERAMNAIDRVEREWDDDDVAKVFRHRFRRAPERHRSAGITLMGVGFGLMFMLGLAAGEPGRGIGIGGFLVLLGIAFFINSVFERRDRERRFALRRNADAPPSSLPQDPRS